MTAGRAPTWLGCQRTALAGCTSTNDLALAAARAGAPHGAVILADAQTAGRGRLGRRWESPPGGNLYLSAVIRAALPLARLAPLTLAIGIGVVDAVRAEGAAAHLKWPNDVVIGRRKLAGILCETAGPGAVVAGIGVNLDGDLAAFPDDVAARATTLAAVLGRAVERDRFADRLLAELEPWIDRFVAGGVTAIAPAWEARMAADLRLRVAGPGAAVRTGVAVGLDPDGALRLRDDTGAVHRIHAGDVELDRPPPAPRPPE